MNTIKSRSARKAVQIVLASGVVIGAAQPALADDIFLKITGLPGNSMDSKHKDEIEVINFQQAFSGSGSGSGAAAGKATCPQFYITKNVDNASPGLAEAASYQRTFPSATLVVRKSSEKGLEYYKIVMSSVSVQAASSSFTNEGGTYESVAFTARTSSMTYIPQKPDGSPGTAITKSVSCTGA